MKNARNEAVLLQPKAQTIDTIVVGQIESINQDGVALVDYPSNPHGPIAAASAVSSRPSCDLSVYKGSAVLLTFENRDTRCPVIIGFVHDTLFPMEAPMETTFKNTGPKDVVIDGETMRFDAKEEITLRCGKSSIILKKDGKVVIRGVEITNRAEGTNRLRGGSVKIN
jgi:hypothetical protein